MGTGRVIFCQAKRDRFFFEKDIPFESIGDADRLRYVEISKLAIEPGAQGSDLFGEIIKEFARHAILNNKAGICLGRTIQRRSYEKYGFRVASYEIPHPRLADQTLALMTWDGSMFLSGRTVTPSVRNDIVQAVAQTAAFAKIAKSSVDIP